MKHHIRLAILALLAALPAMGAAAADASASSQASSLRQVGPAVVTPRFNDVMTAVIYSDQVTVAQLLGLGRWVDKPDSNGLTPLMVAVHLRDEGMVKLLLEHGANPNAQAPGGEDALQMAQANGEGGIERMLRNAGAR
ncbi:MAG TPA: ankyrin repeat domain-containing protein [Burkholderiales bacterium]|nr:ankyrin repeat domain-containing protein [Burkholderiales bacterium]